MDKRLLYVGAVIAFLIYRSTSKAAVVVKESVDVTSDTNLAYRAVNGIGDVLNDGEKNNDFNLGAWLYGVVDWATVNN